MEASVEDYYNLYIESVPISKGDDYKKVAFIACSKEEINKYFEFIKQNQLGFKPFGNQQIEVVIPRVFYIFDFLHTGLPSSKRNKEGYTEEVRFRHRRTQDYHRVFREMGENVTTKFNINLEEILSKEKESSTTTTVTATTTQAPPVTTTETKTTIVDESKQTEENTEIDGKISSIYEGEVIEKGNATDTSDATIITSGNLSGKSEGKSNITGNLTDSSDAKIINSENLSEQGDKLDENEGDNKNIKPESGTINIEGSEPIITVEPIQIFPNVFSDGIRDSSIEPAFEVKKVANVFADHIKNLLDESGQMVGVFGKWGRGKSYFINQVFKQLNSDSEPPFIPIKFQAWKYQNTPSIWAYLFETLIDEYLNVKKRKKYCRILRLSVARNGHWKSWVWPALLIVSGIFTLSISSIFFEPTKNQDIIKIVSIAGTLTVILSSWTSIQKKIKKPAAVIFNSISKAPSFKEILGMQAEIQKELKNLVKAWSKIKGTKRILLFVDDLDRCSQEQMIDIIDSLRIMLDDEQITSHILILVALDEGKLEKAISFKYKNLYKGEELTTVIDEYMDKLFISAIKLFPITYDDRAEFVRKLASQINLEDNAEEESKTKLEPSPTSTSAPETDTNAALGESPDSSEGTAQFSNQATEVPKSSKNLEESEVTILQEKIRLANVELTPRQIRILIYRYLLARNLWIIYSDVIDWKAGDAIDEIMRFSGFSMEDPKAETKVFGGLSKIVRMVVAY
jgi:hypothetical protein